MRTTCADAPGCPHVRHGVHQSGNQPCNSGTFASGTIAWDCGQLWVDTIHCDDATSIKGRFLSCGQVRVDTIHCDDATTFGDEFLGCGQLRWIRDIVTTQQPGTGTEFSQTHQSLAIDRYCAANGNSVTTQYVVTTQPTGTRTTCTLPVQWPAALSCDSGHTVAVKQRDGPAHRSCPK